ncbi:MAG: hypothetical protein ACRDZ6_03725 [Acidimicrobiales bacterium]
MSSAGASSNGASYGARRRAAGARRRAAGTRGGEGSGALRRHRPPWRRGWLIAVVVVVVFIGAAIWVDLPVPVTRSNRASQSVSYVNSLKSDASTCVAGLRESFSIEALVLAGRASVSDRSRVPSLLTDDYNACSLTDNNIYEMESNLPAPTFTGGAKLGALNTALYDWQIQGAEGTIGALSTLLGPPTDLGARAQLLRAEHILAKRHQTAERAWAAAARAVGARLPALDLPQPPPGEVGTRSPG